jgi:hypothetical protein
LRLSLERSLHNDTEAVTVLTGMERGSVGLTKFARRDTGVLLEEASEQGVLAP